MTGDTSLIRHLVDAAHRHRDAVAVTDGGIHHTYAELDAASAEIAGGLAARGIGPGAVVAVLATRSWERCVALLGAWRAGAGVLSVDPGLPPARARKVAHGAGCALVLRAAGLPPAGWDIPEHTVGEVRGPRRDRVTEGPVCYIISTSGSTGEPKAVALPPVVLAGLGRWHVRHWRYQSPPHTLHTTSVGFDVGYEEIVATWLAGAALIVVGDEERQDPFTLVDIIRDNGASRVFLPVVGLHGLAMATAVEAMELPTLREILVSGEPLVVNDEVRNLCARGAIDLVNQYGPSETHVVTQHRLPGYPASWPDHPPIGTPVADAEPLRLEDGRLRPFEPGEEGELVIAGDCVALGYLGDDDLTARKFRTAVHRDGGTRRCYLTGDLVRFDGTAFHFLARADDQLKVNGYRVEPGEVEAVLGGVPGVRRAAVVGVKVAASTQLAAAYLRETGSDVRTDDLIRACAAQLPAYMVPKRFTALDALPVTPNGKIDRARLRDMV
ncbi:AMP-binding protein [Streptomyces triculaminicus]|uniref:AMP-binding protein n=1 Tax=Streptomyces triculaminicus TaxID=2816232 RepID=UPI0037D579B8